MSTLSSLVEVSSAASPDPSGPLARTLAVLFEPSPTLFSHLAPQVAEALSSSNVSLSTYAGLVDLSLGAIATWDDDLKARFIAGHPRIGEVKNLSHLSAKEQAAVATPPEVLARLAHLNACYERCYPGLRYITFVNGRTRTAIMHEMEDVLGLPRSLNATEPQLDSVVEVKVGSPEWRGELERAVQDVGKIAKSRLSALGVE